MVAGGEDMKNPCRFCGGTGTVSVSYRDGDYEEPCGCGGGEEVPGLSRMIRHRLWCAAAGMGVGALILGTFWVSMWLFGDINGILCSFVILSFGAVGFFSGPTIRRVMCDEEGER